MKTPPSKKIAIMQPYLFPYLGYFQLIASVEEFWLLDTVGFVQRGWMNRNNIIVDGRKHRFTIPVTSKSNRDPICNFAYSPEAKRAVRKLRMTVARSYSHAPFVSQCERILSDFSDRLDKQGDQVDFTELTEYALISVLQTIGLETPVQRISSLELPPELTGQSRIIAACKAIGASDYVNMIGGQELYDAADFEDASLTLHFLEAVLSGYHQTNAPGTFIAGLSILDLLAHLPAADIAKRSMEAILTLPRPFLPGHSN